MRRYIGRVHYICSPKYRIVVHTAEEQSTLEELARRARQEGYHLTVEHLADGRMRLEHRNVVFTMPKPLIREYLLELIE